MTTDSSLVDHDGKLLGHVELLHRPGERNVICKVMDTLGFGVLDRPDQRYLIFNVDKARANNATNVIYASEVTQEQWRFEQLLQKDLGANKELGQAFQDYVRLFKRKPQDATHFGIRMSVSMLEDAVKRVRAASKEGPLAGRVEVSATFYPGDPGSLSKTLVQAFIKTDVFAAGLLTLGQHVELQAVTA